MHSDGLSFSKVIEQAEEPPLARGLDLCHEIVERTQWKDDFGENQQGAVGDSLV